MFADILFVIILEAAETTGVEQNKNDHHLRITHPVRLITMPDLLVDVYKRQVYTQGAAVTTYVDPGLKWERTRTTDVGIETAFFNKQ